MANIIKHKRGTTTPTAGQLVVGELAINTTTGSVFTKTDGGSVVSVGGGGTWGSITGTLSSQTDLDTALGLKAPLASPALTGTPTAPTASSTDNSTQIATTAFVTSAVAGATVSSATAVLATVRNETGSTITKGSVVYINGAGGNKATVALAQANSEATSSHTYGLVQSDIANSNNGTIVISGIISGLNTDGFTAGTMLYLSPTTAGGMTSTKPSAPNHMVSIGVVAYQHANQGTIQLAIRNGFEVEELHNAAISSVANNDLFVYETATSLWKNKSASTVGLAPLASPTFTGTPAAPTATAGTNTTQVATTAFVTTAVSTKANLASPTFTGTPAAPTATTATNSTQIATTAYVKSNLVNYATTASPTLTGSPQAPTQSTALESTAIATTAFVKKNIRRPVSTFSGGLTNMAGLEENVAYHSTGNGQHLINLWYAGYYNANGSVIMFKQSDNTQMDFNDGSGYTKAPNGNRWYAAFPNAVIFAVKNDLQDWFIFGDLISTQYTAYGTYISGPNIDTGNTVASGFTDYYGQTVYAYTATNTVENGWGGQTTAPTNAGTGTVMSDNFTYSNNTDTYNLLADGSGGYTLNFVSGSGGGYDPYGTKIGTPYWDSGSGSLLQSIADGNGGSTSIAWDNLAPYPVYGVQVSTTSYNNYGSKTDMIGSSYDVWYDSTYYADGNGGSYESWSVSSGYNLPTGWATTAYFYDTSTQNTSYYFYDQNYNYVYPWKWGYVQADGAGGTSFVESDVAPNGTPASDYFYDNNSNYGRIYADGNYGFYFAS